MSRQKVKKSCEALTPELVIRSRLRRLADQDELKSFAAKLVWMILLLALLFGGIFGITSMRNNDMMPRISSGDLVLYYRLEQKLRSRDVVVFEKSGVQYLSLIHISVRFIKVARRIFCQEKRDLSRLEYSRLIETAEAQGKEQMCIRDRR